MFYITYKNIEGGSYEAGPYELLNIVRDDLKSGDSYIAMYSADTWVLFREYPDADVVIDGFNIIWRD